MKTIPQEIKILKLIKNRLDLLMSNNETSVEIRSNELYEFAKKDSVISSYFKDGREFNRFLKKNHNNGIMKQIIPNYSVDTLNKNFYRWFFSREIKPQNKTRKLVEVKQSSLKYYKNGLTIDTIESINVRSLQEKEILKNLLDCNYLSIEYDYELKINLDKKYVDFKILNRLTQKTFLWEHFGMTNSENYLNSMTEKIEWFKNNGFKTVEFGGNLIYTYYTTDNKLNKDIEKYIAIIMK